MDNHRFRRFAIIGTGRVAQALALGLAPYSAEPLLLWGRSPEQLAAAALRTGAAAASLGEVASSCDVIAIAVSDDALAAVANALAAAIADNETPFVFHVSGRSGVAVLEPLQAAGALTAAIHPAMTFTGQPESEVARMAGARFAITGSTATAAERARSIVGLLKGTAVAIPEERRALYHAALCHASNHLVTLLSGATHALATAGIDDPAALLAPLVRASLENSLEHGFTALSGPLLRGDHQAIEGHLDALEAYRPDLLPAYRAMALATLDELERPGAPDASSTLRRRLV